MSKAAPDVPQTAHQPRSRFAEARRRALAALSRPFPVRWWPFIAVCLFSVGYFVVFLLVRDSPRAALLSTAVNLAALVPLWFAAWSAASMIDARLSGWFALAAQAAAGFAFALAFHFLHSLLTAIVMGGSLSSFDVRPVLPGPASIWQLSQGMLVYAVAALAATLIAAREQALPLPSSEPDAKPSFPQRFFVKDRDEVRPLEVADIACISGAGDYSEILTRTGVHLTRIRLQSFAAQLDPELFVRVHRSLIVSYQSIVRFEPDGTGRLNVELDNGRMVRTSREGAARLKERLL